jgi:release factor glutamine methyltransferase
LPEVAVAVTVQDALTRAERELGEAGCDAPRLDAELLLAAALAVGRERLVIEPERVLEADGLSAFDGLVRRRRGREPVAYILGHKEFRRLTLCVDPRVLIPRPETELLVEVGLGLDRGARVVDVGTGSGAVALALKDERPDLEVWGTDVSRGTLEVAGENARRLGLDVTLVEADLLRGVDQRFDAVLANLPYVERGAALEPEIAVYEPAGALFAGPDGLEVIRRLVATAQGVPLVALEVGAGQAGAVRELLLAAGYASVEALRDLAGHERVVVGRP